MTAQAEQIKWYSETKVEVSQQGTGGGEYYTQYPTGGEKATNSPHMPVDSCPGGTEWSAICPVG